jgi:hypothetical protein
MSRRASHLSVITILVDNVSFGEGAIELEQHHIPQSDSTFHGALDPEFYLAPKSLFVQCQMCGLHSVRTLLCDHVHVVAVRHRREDGRIHNQQVPDAMTVHF